MNTQMTPWTIEIKALATQLRFGAFDARPQPVSVDIAIGALTPAWPQMIEDCMNYQPVCRWLLEDWPGRPYTPRLETRLRELLQFIFDFDQRITWADVSLSAGETVLSRRASRQDFAHAPMVLNRSSAREAESRI